MSSVTITRMMRTKGTAQRRRVIADASTGFQRARVVLYVCAPEPRAVARILADVRDYAAARDWLTTGEVVEDAPTGTPIHDRPGWQRVRRLIESEQAEGIVMGTDPRCPHSHPDRSEIGQWLAERGTAFLVTTTGPVEGDHAA